MLKMNRWTNKAVIDEGGDWWRGYCTDEPARRWDEAGVKDELANQQCIGDCSGDEWTNQQDGDWWRWMKLMNQWRWMLMEMTGVQCWWIGDGGSTRWRYGDSKDLTLFSEFILKNPLPFPWELTLSCIYPFPKSLQTKPKMLQRQIEPGRCKAKT